MRGVMGLRQMIFLVRVYAVYGHVGQFERVIWQLRSAMARLCRQMAGPDIDDCIRDDITDHVTEALVNVVDIERSEGEIIALSRLMIRRRLFRVRAKAGASMTPISLDDVTYTLEDSTNDPEERLELEVLMRLCKLLAKADVRFALMLDRLAGLDNPDIADKHGVTTTMVKTAISRAKAALTAWFTLALLDELPPELRDDVTLLRWQLVEGLGDEELARRLQIHVTKVDGRKRNAWRRLTIWAGQQ
jgi:DNA-directed RNA polymerase specialized sigma24 family protein